MGTAQGNILYRGSSSWIELGVDTSGMVLQTQGAAANPRWTMPVLAFNTRTGNITLTGSDITTALGYTPGNSGSSVLSFNTRTGNVTLTANDITAALGYSATNAITLTGSVTGGPSNGTISTSYAVIANNRILANISGGATSPSANSLSDIIDSGISSTQGVILYRNASGWVSLSPDTNGMLLQTQGAAANPRWTQPVLAFNTRTGNVTLTSSDVTTALGYTPGSSTGSVIVFNTRQGNVTLLSDDVVNALGYTPMSNITLTGAVTGGPGNTSISTSFAAIADKRIMANISGGSAAQIANTLTGILDSIIGTTTGNIIYRSSTAWIGLLPGSNTQVLTQGATVPSWSTLSYSNLPSELQNSLAQVSIPGLMPANSKIMVVPIVQSTQVPANFSGSSGFSFINATSSFTFTVSYIHSNVAANIGTVTFSSASNVAVMSTQAAINLVSGDILYVTTPVGADATLSDVGLTLLLLKQ